MKKIFEKIKENNTVQKYQVHQQFHSAYWSVKRYCECESNISNKLLILDFAIDMIKRDLQAEHISYIIYNAEKYDHKMIKQNGFVPLSYYDENGVEFSTFDDNKMKKKEICLKDDCVIPFPKSRKSLYDKLTRIRDNGFQYSKINHYATYYENVDLCIVENGHHSITAGIYNKDGYIIADSVDISPLYYHLKTNGVSYYNVHTTEKISDVTDFRLALLFEFSKMRYLLQKELETKSPAL